MMRIRVRSSTGTSSSLLIKDQAKGAIVAEWQVTQK
jgi:hypothetical protein